MATLTTSAVASGIQARAGIGVEIVSGTYALAAALALDDVIQMVKIPSGATICEMILTCTDVDTNGAPAIVLDVGDGSDTDRFIDGSTIGQTGGVARLASAGTERAGVSYVYTADDTIDVHVQVGPATGAASGTIQLVVFYTMQQKVV